MSRLRSASGIAWWRMPAALLAALLAAALLPACEKKTEAAREDRPAAAASQPPSELVERGKYLAQAGDCIACHTVPGGKIFAGNRAMPTPFGTLYAPNITPDPETGIGKWTADEFFRMMRTGRSRNGELLYPAMPFASYTKVTRADSDAIFAYMRSVPPVRLKSREHDLRFPYNNRALLIGWRTLYFQEGEYVPDKSKSVEWNRGAYLVEGLGHCAMCHTPINLLGGSSEERAFQGGLIPMQNWYAPSLTSNKEAGLGTWDIQDIVDLLQKGVSNRGTVYGPMAEVTFNSLQFMSDADVRAMAVYLKSLPADQPVNTDPKTAPARAHAGQKYVQGRRIYAERCASCHAEDGRGMPPHYPPLANNQSITMTSAVNPIRMVLNGGYPPGTRRNPMPYGMPPFFHELSDSDIAEVVTYIRTAWGNRGAPVTEREVSELRAATVE